MKRFWLILLSLGLIAAISTQAMAVDVKFNGEYYAAGLYLDKTSLRKDAGPSTAFYFQRLRIGTEFAVAPGLSLITRFDVMERAWGAARTNAANTALDTLSSGTKAENENIAFDYTYVQYASPIGIISAGYMVDNIWATPFGNSAGPQPKISYVLPIKNLTIITEAVKISENSRRAISTGPDYYADADANQYLLMGIYNFKYGSAGILNLMLRDATNRPNGTKTTFYIHQPYVMATFGPVKVQAELQYAWGNKFVEFEDNIPADDMTLSQWAGYLDATVTFGPAYFGGSFAYVQGDDPGTTDKVEGGVLNGGFDWNPCLIMFNNDLSYWAGSQAGYGTTANAGLMSNAFFYQVRGGVKPVEKLDIMASVSYAYADQKPAGYDSDEYGWEVDLTGTYQITNNLSYTLGAGYFFTGDYYKGASTANEVEDNFIFINKLTLTF